MLITVFVHAVTHEALHTGRVDKDRFIHCFEHSVISILAQDCGHGTPVHKVLVTSWE